MTVHPRGLSDLTHRELHDLLRALEAGSLAIPVSDLALRKRGSTASVYLTGSQCSRSATVLPLAAS